MPVVCVSSQRLVRTSGAAGEHMSGSSGDRNQGEYSHASRTGYENFAVVPYPVILHSCTGMNALVQYGLRACTLHLHVLTCTQRPCQKVCFAHAILVTDLWFVQMYI